MPPTLRERWLAAPRWARWAAGYAALVVAALALGPFTLGAGDILFLAGIVALLWSLTYIRFGGRKARVGRDERTGRPIYAVDEDARNVEIRRGLEVFAFAMACWAPLVAATLLRA